MRILTRVKIHPPNESLVSITSDDGFKARVAGELADGIPSVRHDRRSVQSIALKGLLTLSIAANDTQAGDPRHCRHKQIA